MSDKQNPAFLTVFLLFVFFPIGAYFLWKKTNWSNISKIVLTFIFGFLFIGILGGMFESTDETPLQVKDKKTIKKSKLNWFSGGNLHKSTIAQWKKATYRNKLATASDWLAGTKWKGHLNSSEDFDKLKIKAHMLVKAVNKTIKGKKTDSLMVSEMAAMFITLTNDLDP